MFCVGDRVRLVQLDPNESPYFPEMVDLVGKLFLVAQVNRYSMGYTTCECYEVDDENAGTWVLRGEDLELENTCHATGNKCLPGCAGCPVNHPDEKVDHPKHYTYGSIETIEVIEDWNLGYNLGNALKYIARADHKGNPVEDLKKARWYLEREIGLRSKEC